MKEAKNIKLSLAPMAGITDLPFRLVCKKMGADIVYSEMISATGLFYGQNEKSLLLAQSIKDEAPVAIQLFGNDPKHFAKATKIISSLNNKKDKNFRKVEEININLGCPARKVFKENSGCALMKKPALAKKIIEAVSKNTDLPVSIKIRAGIKSIEAIEFLKEIEGTGWDKVIVHGRTYEEGFSGKIDFEKIKEIKKEFPKKEIVANGGIFTPEDAKEVIEKTGVRHLAIARGCWGNPWAFKQIKDYLKTGKYEKPSLEEIKSVALEHAQLFLKYTPNKNLIAFRKNLGWYFRNFPKAKKMREELFQVKNLNELKNILK